MRQYTTSFRAFPTTTEPCRNCFGEGGFTCGHPGDPYAAERVCEDCDGAGVVEVETE